MSEISTYISSGPAVPTRPGLPGRPQRGRRVAVLDPARPERICEPGEIGLLAVHRSDPGLMLGYWRRPEEEGTVFLGEWFAGGDLAEQDADGYIRFHGRHDDVMNALGVRASPIEIEEILVGHPAVHEVAVTQTENAERVALVTAFVVRQEGTLFDPEALAIWARERLAAYKVPKRWIEVDALPRTANGKVRRGVLRERHAGA